MPDIPTLQPGPLIEKYLDPEQLDSYYRILMAENRSVNLVSRETSRPDFDRMVAESLLPLGSLSKQITNYLDIGSGGGIPAIPILLSGTTKGRTYLVERTIKRAKALKRLVEKLDLKASVIPANFGELSDLPKSDLITLRYVKLGFPLLKRILGLLTPSGLFVYYATPEFDLSRFSVTNHNFICSQSSALKSFTIFQK